MKRHLNDIVDHHETDIFNLRAAKYMVGESQCPLLKKNFKIKCIANKCTLSYMLSLSQTDEKTKIKIKIYISKRVWLHVLCVRQRNWATLFYLSGHVDFPPALTESRLFCLASASPLTALVSLPLLLPHDLVFTFTPSFSAMLTFNTPACLLLSLYLTILKFHIHFVYSWFSSAGTCVASTSAAFHFRQRRMPISHTCFALLLPSRRAAHVVIIHPITAQRSHSSS